MKVLWMANGALPSVCQALGFTDGVPSPWLEPMLEALLTQEGETRYCILSWDWRAYDVTIGRVRHVSFGVAPKSWYTSLPKCLRERTRQLVEAFNPDVIHVQGTEYFFGLLGEEVWANRPVVVSLQGLVTGCWPWMSGALTPKELRTAHLTNVRFWLKRASLFRTQEDWRRHRAEQEREILRRNHFFIGRTGWDRAVLRAHNPKAAYFTANENLRNSFYETIRQEAQVAPHAIYCGAAAAYPLKGAHILLRAVALLRDEFPDVRLRIANAAALLTPPSVCRRVHESAYHGYLRGLVRALDLSGHVVALPPLSADEVARELSTAGVYASASFCENSPNSMGEAMLVGTPVIHAMVGGVPSLLTEGVTGRLVPSGDAYAMADALRQTFCHREKARDMAAAARKIACERHDRARNARTVLSIYKEVVNK